MRKLAETFAIPIDKAGKLAKTFAKSDRVGPKVRMCRTPARKVSLSLEVWAKNWSRAQVSGRQVRESAETFADFVDQVGKSPETFLKSDGTEAGSPTYLRGLPRQFRQTSQIGGGTAEKWSVAARCCPPRSELR